MKGSFTPRGDSWFDLEVKEINGESKVIRLKADEKMYEDWKAALENAFKMREKKPSEELSSEEDEEPRLRGKISRRIKQVSL